MKKSITILLLFPTLLFADSYVMGLSSSTVNSGSIVVVDYVAPVAPSEPVADNGNTCKVLFDNVYSTGQYGSPAMSDLKIKMSNDSYYDYGSLSNSTTTGMDFEGGYVLGQTYGSAWYMGGLIDGASSGYGMSYPYFMGRTVTTSTNTVQYGIHFDSGVDVKEVEFIDYVSSARYTTNYDLVLIDCDGEETFRKTFTVRQSTNINVSTTVSVL